MHLQPIIQKVQKNPFVSVKLSISGQIPVFAAKLYMKKAQKFFYVAACRKLTKVRKSVEKLRQACPLSSAEKNTV